MLAPIALLAPSLLPQITPETDIASLGLHWWLTPFFALFGDYRYIWNELGGEEGTSSGINTRVLLLLE